MEIKVGKHNIIVNSEPINEKEVNITTCNFTFDDDITSDYTKEAYFTKGNNTYKVIIDSDMCDIPNEILATTGKVEIGVSYFKIENDEVTRYNPTSAYFYILKGSLKDNTVNGIVIKTPSELEYFENEIKDFIKEINVDVDVSKTGNTATVTATNSLGETHTVEIYDGEPGSQGPKGDTGAAGAGINTVTQYYAVSDSNTTAPSTWTTDVSSITLTPTNKYLWNYEVITYTEGKQSTETGKKVIGVYGDKGETGATGKGVSSITEQYYLSTSKTTQTGGSWAETPPAWENGKYIWTRSKIVYTNPASTTYTTPIVSSEWEAVNEVPNYIASRGENLITNGTALLGDNTNFSVLEYDGSDTYNAGGSFKGTGYRSVPTDEYIPIDVSNTYELSYYIKVDKEGIRYYDFIACYDIDKLNIGDGHVMYVPGSLTTLSQELKNGDTVVHLTDVSGFVKNKNGIYSRKLIFWNYTNSFGYTYPEETYSRNVTATNLWADDNTDIDYTNNTITLRTAWTYGTYPAGTKVSQGNNGANMKYLNAYYTLEKDVWTHKTGKIGGLGNNNSSGFRDGTAYVKPGWWFSYGNTGSGAVSRISTITFTQNTGISESVASLDVEYYLSTSSTTTTGGSWSTTAPQWVDGKYMWSRQKLTFGNGTVQYKNQTCIAGATGATGSDGDDGRGIVSVVQHYLATSASSGVTTSTSGWTTSVQTMTSTNKYLWNYTTTTYTSGTTTENSTPCIIGVYGLTGDAGRGIAKITPLYYCSSTNTAPAKPTAHVTTSSLVGYNTWNILCPTYTTIYKYYYTCSEIQYDTDPVTYAWTDVVADQSVMFVNNLQIGGRNLELDTTVWGKWGNSSGITIEGDVAKLTSAQYPWYGPIDVETNKEYTISVDVKSDEAHTPSDGIILLDFFTSSNRRVTYQWLNAPYTTDWVRKSWTFTVPNNSDIKRLGVGFRDNAVKNVYFRHLKVETGNKATDWTPAPEDISEEINDVNNNFSNYVTQTSYDSDWTNRKDEIYSYVSQQYTTTSMFGQYQETMQTALSQKADATTISATATQVVNDAISGIQSTISDINETFTFDTNGLTIARGGNTMYLQLQNDRLSFRTDSTDAGERAYMTSNAFVLKELAQFQIGNFKFEVRTNGSLDFKKV